MPTALTSEHVRSNNRIFMWDHDPGVSTALITSPDGGTTKRYVAMRDYKWFFAAAMSSTLTGAGIQLIEIVAATSAAGADETVVLAGSAVVADAVGDWTSLEVSAEQVKEVGDAAGKVFTHVGLRLTLANAADEAVVLYLFTDVRFKGKELTPVSTIA